MGVSLISDETSLGFRTVSVDRILSYQNHSVLESVNAKTVHDVHLFNKMDLDFYRTRRLLPGVTQRMSANHARGESGLIHGP